MDHVILLGNLKLYAWVDCLSLKWFGPTYLTESSKPLLMELDLISVM